MTSATRAASSLHALDEWRSAYVARSVSIRISSGLRGDAIWHVELWSCKGKGGESIGVAATSGSFGSATREALKRAEEAGLS